MEEQTGGAPREGDIRTVSVKDDKNDKLMAAIAYIGPLIIVSYIMGKDNPFVKFHIKQALVLFVIEIIL